MKLSLSALVVQLNAADNEGYRIESLLQAKGDGRSERQIDVYELAVQTRASRAPLELNFQLSLGTVDYGHATRGQMNHTTRCWCW